MTDSTKQKIRKRRFFRFSLRSFLIAVTLFGVVVGPYIYRAEKQKATVQWLLENGATVSYDWTVVDRKNNLVSDSPPFVPKWLLHMLGVDYFSTVTKVDNELAGLMILDSLSLPSTQVSDLTPLAGLTNLEILSLSNTQVSDLTPLTGLTNLKSLRLSNTQVSDLTPLTGLTNLKALRLRKTKVSDLTPLAGLTNLEFIDLRNTKVTNEEIKKLQKALPNCRILH